MIFFEKKIRAIESWENGHNQAGWVKAEAKKKKVEQAMSSEFQNFMSTNSSLLELKLSLQLEQVLP